MKTRPVHDVRQPGYPIRPAVDQHPELLRLLPRRWQSNAAILTALAACLAMSCRASAEDAKASKDTTSRVAPIFQHGDGTSKAINYGAIACMSVHPPVVYSEHQAELIINDEAKRSGIDFSNRKMQLKNVEVPREPSKDDKSDQKPELFAVRFDGADEQRHIYYEYVSDTDLKNWEVKGGTKETAERLQKNLEKKHSPGTYAVFYGPNDVAGQDEDNLRQQVRDFIVWLKAQGVI